MSALRLGQSNFGLIIQHLLLPALNLNWVTISVTPYTVAFHDGSPVISGLVIVMGASRLHLLFLGIFSVLVFLHVVFHRPI